MAPKNTNLEVKTRFGRRKLDDEAYLTQSGAKSRTITASGVRFGKRKGDAEPERTAEPAAPPEPDGEKGARANPFLVVEGDSVKRLSLGKTEELLAATPELLDLAIATETQMEFGPQRKGAIVLFRDIEEAKEPPRKRVLDLLTALGE